MKFISSWPLVIKLTIFPFLVPLAAVAFLAGILVFGIIYVIAECIILPIQGVMELWKFLYSKKTEN